MLACVEGIMTASIAHLPHTGVVGPSGFDNILNLGVSLPECGPSTEDGSALSEGSLCMSAIMASDFHNISVELIGDTGAAHDIGSERAILEQGVDPEILDVWKGMLDQPVNFLTGGGVRQSNEAVNLLAKALGNLQVHLLKDCPLAMSIGRQVKRGRTFVWGHGKIPHIALNHKKCRVWWHASRVK